MKMNKMGKKKNIRGHVPQCGFETRSTLMYVWIVGGGFGGKKSKDLMLCWGSWVQMKSDVGSICLEIMK